MHRTKPECSAAQVKRPEVGILRAHVGEERPDHSSNFYGEDAEAIPGPYEKHAQHIAIRLAIHLADIGAAGNAQYADAWKSSTTED